MAAVSTTEMTKNGNGAVASVSEARITTQAMNAVNSLIASGRLHLPADYSAENAIKAAELILPTIQNLDKKHILVDGKLTGIVTKESVANALMSMVVLGLNPVKKQGYFIVYGNQLVWQTSYFGDIAVAQRVKPGIEPYYDTIREGEEIVIGKERGAGSFVTVIKDHKMSFPRSSKIVGAYCGFFGVDGNDLGADIFDIDRIKASWKQSKTYKPDSNTPHNNFSEEMCLRTVIRHRCKPIINASNDAELLQAMRKSQMDAVEGEVAAEAAMYANQEVIDVTPTAPAQLTQSAPPADPAGEPSQSRPATTASAAAPTEDDDPYG